MWKLGRAERNEFFSRSTVCICGVLLACGLVLLHIPVESTEEHTLAAVPHQLPSELGKVLRCEDDAPSLYAFLHLHKTGGNHLKRVLSIWSKHNDVETFQTCRPAKRESVLIEWLFWRKKRVNIDFDCNLKEFVQLADDERQSYKLVLGHMYFGVHLLLPTKHARYFTMLREPIQRKVSHFGHFEFHHGNASDTRIEWNEKWTVGLHHYLLHENLNYMTKRLGITGAGESEIYTALRAKSVDLLSTAGDELLRQAKVNLRDQFFFVGVYDRFQESSCILAEIFKNACIDQSRASDFELKAKRLFDRNYKPQTSAVSLAQQLDPAIRAQAKRAEKLDVALYDFAMLLLEAKLDLYPQCRGG